MAARRPYITPASYQHSFRIFRGKQQGIFCESVRRHFLLIELSAEDKDWGNGLGSCV
jgi:hypothetical protein